MKNNNLENNEINNDIDSENSDKKIDLDSIEFTKILNKKSGFKNFELLIFAIIIMIITIFLTLLFVHEINPKIKDNTSEVKISASGLEKFEEVYDLINKSYYKETDKEKMIDGAISGMLKALEDPHTSYFTKEETENFNEIMNGSYEGIGAEITIDKDNNIIIASVFKNSPASEVGLKFNDIILEVNGKSTKGLTTEETVALIKDSSKPIANIKVNRNNQTLSFDVKKRIVTIESVTSKTFNRNGKKIGYIIVENFANNTYEQFKSSIESMEKDGISGLVIDVRNNSGGYLHSVTSMLDMFLSKGQVSYKMQDNKKIEIYKSQTSESRNYPISVIINKASASASEILAISLKESYGAKVVGTYSYGKGTVQVTEDLPSGGMIKYTIQKWLSPNGNWINDVGVEPNYKVELSEQYLKDPCEENDNQLQKALEVVTK